MAQVTAHPSPVTHHLTEVGSNIHLTGGQEGIAALCAAGFLGVVYLKYRWGGRSGVDRYAREARRQTKYARKTYEFQREQAAGVAGQTGAAVRYHAKRTYRALLIPAGIFLTVLYVYGLIEARQTTIVWTIVAALGALVYGWKTRARRLLRKRVIEPLAAGVAQLLGYDLRIQPWRQWLQVPPAVAESTAYVPMRLNPRIHQRAAMRSSLAYANWRAERLAKFRVKHRPQIDWMLHHDPRNSEFMLKREARRQNRIAATPLVVALPPTWPGSAEQQRTLSGMIQQRIAGDWEPHYNFQRYFLEFTPRPQPPESVMLADLLEEMERCADGEFILGLDNRAAFYRGSMETEYPHWALAMGTGAGKSTSLWSLGVQCAIHNYEVFALDPKIMSLSPFFDVPGFTIWNDPMQIGGSWQIIKAFRREMERRYQVWRADNSAAEGFTRWILLIEELNTLADLWQAYWDEVKPKGAKSRPEIWGDLAAILWMARQVKMNVVAVAQRLDAASTGGRGIRDSFGLKGMGRWSPQAWKMVVGTSPIPRPVKKRGRILFVDGDSHTWVQAPLSTATEAHDLAMMYRERAGYVATAPAVDLSSPPVATPTAVPGTDAPSTAGEGSRPVVIVPELYSLADASEDRGISIVPLTYENLRYHRKTKNDFPAGVAVEGRSGQMYDPDQLRSWYYEYRAKSPVKSTGTEG
jgi:hypothetical protein